jgi:hypothetical protein
LTFLVLAGLLAFTAHAAKEEPAKGFRYQIVTRDDSDITHSIVDDLVPRLVPVFAGFSTELAQRRRMLYVTIGPAALRDVTAQPCDCVVIAAYTSSQVFHEIVDRLPAARAREVTAVYAEPAPADQLRLADLLYRRPARVAAIVGRNTAFLKPSLAAQHVVVVDADAVAADDSGGGKDDGAGINRVLNRIAQTDVLLALPDSTVYNTDNIRNILLSTYRHKQGVIGFSGDMVKAGALATTYSDAEDINVQVTEVAARYIEGGELEPPRFPHYFRTVVNEGVADSLDLKVTDAVRRFARRPPDAEHRP